MRTCVRNDGDATIAPSLWPGIAYDLENENKCTMVVLHANWSGVDIVNKLCGLDGVPSSSRTKSLYVSSRIKAIFRERAKLANSLITSCEYIAPVGLFGVTKTMALVFEVIRPSASLKK